MFQQDGRARLLLRVALTLICLVGFRAVWSSPEDASAQTERVCSNTVCADLERCYFHPGLKCAFAPGSCTIRSC